MRRMRTVPRMKSRRSPRPPIAARWRAASLVFAPSTQARGVRTRRGIEVDDLAEGMNAGVGAAGADGDDWAAPATKRDRLLHRVLQRCGMRLRLPAGIVACRRIRRWRRRAGHRRRRDAARYAGRPHAGRGPSSSRAAIRSGAMLPVSGWQSLPARLLRGCCARLPDRPYPCRRGPGRAWCPTSLMVTGSNSGDRHIDGLELVGLAPAVYWSDVRSRSAPRRHQDRRAGCVGWPRTLPSRTLPRPLAAARAYRRCRGAVARRSRSRSMLSALMPRSFEVESMSSSIGIADVRELGRRFEARSRGRTGIGFARHQHRGRGSGPSTAVLISS